MVLFERAFILRRNECTSNQLNIINTALKLFTKYNGREEEEGDDNFVQSLEIVREALATLYKFIVNNQERYYYFHLYSHLNVMYHNWEPFIPIKSYTAVRMMVVLRAYIKHLHNYLWSNIFYDIENIVKRKQKMKCKLINAIRFIDTRKQFAIRWSPSEY